MSITYDVDDLYLEKRSARAFVDSRLANWPKAKARFHGPFYRDDSPDEEWFPENHYFEAVAQLVPEIVYENPRLAAQTKRRGPEADVARAIQHGLNRWTRDVKLIEQLQEACQDMLFNWGVLRVAQEPTPGEHAEDRWRIQLDEDLQPLAMVSPKATRRPAVYRVAQVDFFIDPRSTGMRDARFVGHDFERSLRDCLQEAREDPESWNIEALRELYATGALHRQHQDRDDPRMDGLRDDIADRDIVYGSEMWVPELPCPKPGGGHFSPKDGYHGTIFTLTTYEDHDGNKRVAELRPPRPYYGPRTGPYVMFGVYRVPDEPLPLGPLVAIEGNIVSLNRKVLATLRADIEFKRLVLYDEADAVAAQLLRDTPDGYFCGIPDLDSTAVKQVEIGGSTPEQHAGIAIDRDRLDRASGMSDASRGQVTGVGTATENQIAAEMGGVRKGHMRQQFKRACLRLYHTVGWYLYHDDRVDFPLGEEAFEEYGEEVWFRGGTHGEGTGATYDDLELEIVPFSMERADQAGHVASRMRGFGLLMEVAPVMEATAHFIRWPKALDELGDVLNWPGLGQLVDEQALQSRPGPMGGMYLPQPRLGRDLGAKGAGTGAFAGRANPRGGQGGGALSKVMSLMGGASRAGGGQTASVGAASKLGAPA